MKFRLVRFQQGEVVEGESGSDDTRSEIINELTTALENAENSNSEGEDQDTNNRVGVVAVLRDTLEEAESKDTQSRAVAELKHALENAEIEDKDSPAQGQTESVESIVEELQELQSTEAQEKDAPEPQTDRLAVVTTLKEPLTESEPAPVTEKGRQLKQALEANDITSIFPEAQIISDDAENVAEVRGAFTSAARTRRKSVTDVKKVLEANGLRVTLAEEAEQWLTEEFWAAFKIEFEESVETMYDLQKLTSSKKASEIKRDSFQTVLNGFKELQWRFGRDWKIMLIALADKRGFQLDQIQKYLSSTEAEQQVDSKVQFKTIDLFNFFELFNTLHHQKLPEKFWDVLTTITKMAKNGLEKAGLGHGLKEFRSEEELKKWLREHLGVKESMSEEEMKQWFKEHPIGIEIDIMSTFAYNNPTDWQCLFREQAIRRGFPVKVIENTIEAVHEFQTIFAGGYLMVTPQAKLPLRLHHDEDGNVILSDEFWAAFTLQTDANAVTAEQQQFSDLMKEGEGLKAVETSIGIMMSELSSFRSTFHN